MSVSDPLIKDLKGWTRKLIDCQTVTDDSPHLLSFCGSLEKCLQQGLGPSGSGKDQDAWYWMQDIRERQQADLSLFPDVIDSVARDPRVLGSGRLRLLMRTCLVKRCLHVPVQLLVRGPGLAGEYYQPGSILGDEILGEIFLSVLLQISRLSFQLDLKNSRFLEESWQLPVVLKLELVPCKRLGISVEFVKKRAVIVGVEENSVAAEDGQVEVGDVLDEVNGTVLSGGGPGVLGRVLKKFTGLPISLRIIKHHFDLDDFYGPIVNLFLQSEVPSLRSLILGRVSKNRVSKNQGETIFNRLENSGYAVTYCGVISTGNQGDVRQIEQAIWRLLGSSEVRRDPVRFECLEMGIRVTRESDNVIVLSQSYMEISSCGRTANIPDYFAFIAGNTTCNISTTFDAFVFYLKNESEVQIILQSLGQGFHRTHFAV